MTYMRVVLAGAVLLSGLRAQSLPKQDYPIQPVPFPQVHVHDKFWAPRIETNRKVSIPTAFAQCERTGRIENFVRAATVLRGEKLDDKHAPPFPFDDSDAFKVIEGASYTLAVHPDPKLEAYVDGLIAKIAAAQEPDGYLYTTRTIDPQHPHAWSGTVRWQNEEILSHELYNLGHLYEAAVAYYQATGKRSLLDVSTKSADLLVETFGAGKRKIYSGHQIVEMGLVKLYRVTGKEQYLTLAKFLLDCRSGGRAYNQADIPVVDQSEAEGHAVRATYMYSGMADVAALTHDQAYLHAIDEIWENVVSKKMYVTGGIGALHEGEAFGANYQLPNMTAYNETCAAVGENFWNERLFLLHGDAKYVDVFERTLYNGLISGVALDGETYFYPNPLESNGQHQRSPWFGVACCPSNITRFMPSIPGYVYAEAGDVLYVNLFMSNTAEITLGNGRKVTMEQETRYPWDGQIKMTVTPEATGPFTLKVRVPGWARGEAMPSDLYRFTDDAGNPEPVLRVNGRKEAMHLDKGYATITREWKKGDTVALDLPMPVRRVAANEKVKADEGRFALQRGPIVYCLEWPESPDKHVRNLMVDPRERLKAEWRADLLNGVETLGVKAVAYRYGAHGELEHAPETVQAIPYYAWANRGKGQMEVWIAESESGVRAVPFPTLASESKVSASGSSITDNGVKDPGVVTGGEQTASSGEDISYYDWRPHKGTAEWIQYDFAKAAKVSHARVAWYERSSEKEIRLPAAWRLLYREGGVWKPVEAEGAYGVEAGRFNEIAFKPVETSALRLEVQLAPNASAAIKSWTVE